MIDMERAKTEAIVLQAAIGASFSKDAAKHFKEILENLDGNE